MQDTREAVDCRPTCEQRQGDEGLLPSPGDAQQLSHLARRALVHLSLVRAQCLQAGSRALVVWALALGRQQGCVRCRDRAAPARLSMNIAGNQGGQPGGNLCHRLHDHACRHRPTTSVQQDHSWSCMLSARPPAC